MTTCRDGRQRMPGERIAEHLSERAPTDAGTMLNYCYFFGLICTLLNKMYQENVLGETKAVCKCILYCLKRFLVHRINTRSHRAVMTTTLTINVHDNITQASGARTRPLRCFAIRVLSSELLAPRHIFIFATPIER